MDFQFFDGLWFTLSKTVFSLCEVVLAYKFRRLFPAAITRIHQLEKQHLYTLRFLLRLLGICSIFQVEAPN